jgi:hypothetical protein
MEEQARPLPRSKVDGSQDGSGQPKNVVSAIAGSPRLVIFCDTLQTVEKTGFSLETPRGF